MKTLVVIIGIISALFHRNGDRNLNFETVEVLPSVRYAKLKIIGYTCSMCGLSVEKALLTLPFVKSVEADLQSTTMQLYFHPNKKIDPSKIGDKVKGAGFSISSMKYYFSGPQSVSENKIEIGGFEYVICKMKLTDSMHVIGKDLVSKKEFQRYKEIFSCEDSGSSYFLDPLE